MVYSVITYLERKEMLDVTADDCGAWITAEEVRNSTILYTVRVIDIAVHNGFDIDWEADRAVIIARAADEQLLDYYMEDVYYNAMEYLNSIVPEPFYFYTCTDGLFLATKSDSKAVS